MQLQSYLGAPDYMIPELDPNFLDGSLGIDESTLKDIGENLAENTSAFASDVANALAPFSEADRQTIIGSFLAFGGSPGMVSSATQILRSQQPSKASAHTGFTIDNPKVRIAWGVLGTASMAASAFHGYRRNQSIGWALVWGLLGATFPVITPTVALAQGFGQSK